MTMHHKIPHCMGQYAAEEVECQGDPDSAIEHERLPCPVVDRCKAFGLHLKRTDKPATDYLAPGQTADGDFFARPLNGKNNFVKFLDALVRASRPGPSPKPVKKRKPLPPGPKPLDKRKKGPSPLTIKAASKAHTRRHCKRIALMAEMYEQFETDLAAELGRELVAPSVAPLPGQLYTLNYAKSSGYVTVLCKTPTGGIRGVPVVSLKFKTMTLTFQATFPVEIEDMNELPRSKLQHLAPMKSIEDGKFKTMSTVHLDSGGLALLAETLALLVKIGKIDLPRSGE